MSSMKVNALLKDLTEKLPVRDTLSHQYYILKSKLYHTVVCCLDYVPNAVEEEEVLYISVQLNKLDYAKSTDQLSTDIIKSLRTHKDHHIRVVAEYIYSTTLDVKYSSRCKYYHVYHIHSSVTEDALDALDELVGRLNTTIRNISEVPCSTYGVG